LIDDKQQPKKVDCMAVTLLYSFFNQKCPHYAGVKRCCL